MNSKIKSQSKLQSQTSAGKLFKPINHPGGWISLSLALLFLVIASGSASSIPNRPISASLFWLVILTLINITATLYFLYQAIAFWQLSYFISRNGLEIKWGATTHRIPINNIIAISPATDAPLPTQTLLGITMPVWWISRQQNTAFYNTVPLTEALIIKTEQENLIISPQNQQAFLEAWTLRISLKPTQQWPQEVLHHSFLGYPLWHDPLAMRLLGISIVLCLILVGSTLTRYNNWPPIISLQLNAISNTPTLVNRNFLLWIPGGGLIILLINTILGLIWYKTQALATYLIWFISILVQIGLGVGIWMAV